MNSERYESSSRVLNPEILKACDVRGIVLQQLSEHDLYAIGRAFGTMLRQMDKQSCIAGYDGRESSVSLAEAAVAGLLDAGIDVTVISLVPTPAVYYAVAYLHADAGIMITASHNPAQYNGCKFVLSDGLFHGSSITDLARICENGTYCSGKGVRTDRSITREYITYLLSFLTVDPDFNPSIVWDPGNGAAAAVLRLLTDRLPGTHRIICGEVDGSFPNHHPDPSLKVNMRMLQEAVRTTGADAGIAFDGDGDRIGVVDDQAVILSGDQLLSLYARDLLRRRPGSTVMSEVKAGKLFYDEVASCGGHAIMWKVGHTNQKERMWREHIPLAGETSGHIFFEENNGYDDGLFSAVKLLNLLSDASGSLSDLRERMPIYHDSGEIRIPQSTLQSSRTLELITEALSRQGRPFISIDGLRVTCADGFWMLRASNTQPHLTIRSEAATAGGLKECLQDLTEKLQAAGVDYERQKVVMD